MANNKCMNPACRREISKRVMYCPDCAKVARDRINGDTKSNIERAGK